MRSALKPRGLACWLIILVAISSLRAYQGPGYGLFDFSDEKSGTSVLPFLELPVGPAPVAMGGFAGANIAGPTALFWNPAQAALLPGFRADFTHSELYGQYRHESVAALFPVGGGFLGASFAGLFAKTFAGARDIEENDYDPAAMDFALGISWAQELWADRLWLGGTVNWLHSQLDDVHGDGYGLDLGVVGNMLWGHKASAGVRNLAHGFNYRSGTNYLEKLPTTVRLGWALADTLLPWAYSLGYSKSNDGLQRLHYGVEWNWRRAVFVRLGYEQDLHDAELGGWRGLSGGLGLSLNSLSLDYGLRSGGHLGLVHVIGLKVHPPVVYQERIDHLALAQKAFRHGSCTEVNKHARQVLKNDPTNLQAVHLLQECAKEDEVLQGNYVALAFTGNTESQIAPFYRDAGLVGGLSRRKTVVDALRRQYPHLLLLDAGGVHAEYAADSSIQRMLELYELFDYAAMALDTGVVAVEHKSASFPYISSYPWIEKIAKYRELKVGKHRVGVFSINALGRAQSEINEALLQAQEQHGGNTVAQVVLLNGTLAQGRGLAQATNFVDLLILSGQQSLLMTPIMEGKTRIVSPGRRGEAVGLAVLWLRGAEAEWETRILAVDGRLPPDSTMAQLLDEVQVVPENENLRIVGLDSAGFLFMEAVADLGSDVWHCDANLQIRRLTRSPQRFVDVQQAFSRQSFVSVVDSAGQRALWWQSFADKNARKIFDQFSVRQVGWEPHENWVYFTVESGGTADIVSKVGHESNAEAASGDLWRCTWLGANCTNLSQGKYQVQSFHFAGSGYHLAFTRDSAGVHSVYHSDYKLLAPVRVSADSMNAYAPVYDRSGERLAFLVGRAAAGGDVWIWHRQGDYLERVTVERHIKHFAWNDENTLLLNSGINIYDSFVLDLRDGSEKPLLAAQREDDSESAHPRPQMLQGQKGILLEYRHEGKRQIKWLNPQGEAQNLWPHKEQIYLPRPHGRN